jgi:hypothetical protein
VDVKVLPVKCRELSEWYQSARVTKADICIGARTRAHTRTHAHTRPHAHRDRHTHGSDSNCSDVRSSCDNAITTVKEGGGGARASSVNNVSCQTARQCC